jgi:translation initiation factor IF-3
MISSKENLIDYGKFRYDQTKREKESRKTQHQVKVKEVKLKPNIDEHDFQTKLKRARQFLEKGNKVKLTCFFRGREMAHTDVGKKVVQRFCDESKYACVSCAMLVRSWFLPSFYTPIIRL